MPRIKLIKVSSQYDCDISYHSIVGKGEWEEISDEDLDFLNKYIYKLTEWDKDGHSIRVVIIEDLATTETVAQLKERLAKTLEKEAAAQKLKEKKAAEAKKQKALSSKAKKLKQLEKLKAELGVE